MNDLDRAIRRLENAVKAARYVTGMGSLRKPITHEEGEMLQQMQERDEAKASRYVQGMGGFKKPVTPKEQQWATEYSSGESGSDEKSLIHKDEETEEDEAGTPAEPTMRLKEDEEEEESEEEGISGEGTLEALGNVVGSATKPLAQGGQATGSVAQLAPLLMAAGLDTEKDVRIHSFGFEPDNAKLSQSARNIARNVRRLMGSLSNKTPKKHTTIRKPRNTNVQIGGVQETEPAMRTGATAGVGAPKAPTAKKPKKPKSGIFSATGRTTTSSAGFRPHVDYSAELKRVAKAVKLAQQHTNPTWSKFPTEQQPSKNPLEKPSEEAAMAGIQMPLRMRRETRETSDEPAITMPRDHVLNVGNREGMSWDFNVGEGGDREMNQVLKDIAEIIGKMNTSPANVPFEYARDSISGQIAPMPRKGKTHGVDRLDPYALNAMKGYAYSTIRRGKVKVRSKKQHQLLEARKLPHTHVYSDGKRKRVYAKGITLSKDIGEALVATSGMVDSLKLQTGEAGFPVVECPFNCTIGSSIILGDNKPIEDYKVEDRVIQSSGIGRVLKTYEHDYDGKTLVIKADGLLPLVLTPEHQVLISEGERERSTSRHWNTLKSPNWKEAKSLMVKKKSGSGDYLLVPIIKRTEETNNLVVQRSLFDNWSKENINLPLNKNVAWLFGLYVADGSAGSAIRIDLGEFEVNLAQRAKEIFESLGITCRIVSERKMNRVYAYSRPLSRQFRIWFGEKASNKRIPDWILMNGEDEIVKSFIDGYLDGDGHIDEKRGYVLFDTVSPILAQQIQLMAASIGKPLSLRATDRKTYFIKGKSGKVRPIYTGRMKIDKGNLHSRLKTIDGYVAYPIRSVNDVDFEGKVWNLETEDNTYLLSNAIVHNCGWKHRGDEPDAFGELELHMRRHHPSETERLQQLMREEDRATETERKDVEAEKQKNPLLRRAVERYRRAMEEMLNEQQRKSLVRTIDLELAVKAAGSMSSAVAGAFNPTFGGGGVPEKRRVKVDKFTVPWGIGNYAAEHGIKQTAGFKRKPAFLKMRKATKSAIASILTIDFTNKEMKRIEKGIKKQDNKYSICTASVGRENKDKYERCLQHLAARGYSKNPK